MNSVVIFTFHILVISFCGSINCSTDLESNNAREALLFCLLHWARMLRQNYVARIHIFRGCAAYVGSACLVSLRWNAFFSVCGNVRD